jgi:hypothetical protein
LLFVFDINRDPFENKHLFPSLFEALKTSAR